MKKIFLMMFIISCFISCDTSLKTGSIYGIVTIEETAEPMRATGVELYHYGSLLLKTVTYDDGHYEFENLATGEYELKVTATGYEDASYDVIVEAGRAARADMQLKQTKTYMTVRTLDLTIIINKASFSGDYTGRASGYNNTTTKATEAGFIYSISQNNIINGTKVTASFVNHVTNGSNYEGYYGSGTFEADVNDLSAGTYYVMAYTKNDYGIEYGDIKSFEISGLPVVKTLGASNYTETTATLNGCIDYSGDPAFTERGFVYSAFFSNPTIDDPATATSKVIVTGTSKEFGANIAGLTASTHYYVRAYASNEKGTSYGASLKFPDNNYIELPSEGLMIHKSDISSGSTWEDADDLCKSSLIGGFSDWRLPTTGEWQLIYSSIIAGTISNIISQDYYWTSTNDYSDRYYVYYFYNNSIRSRDINTKNRVRCVRTLK